MPVVKKTRLDPGPSSNISDSRSNSDSESEREEGKIDHKIRQLPLRMA